MTKLWRFPGGIRLQGRKQLSSTRGIQRLPEPNFVTLPLKQHAGSVAEPVVQVGDKVAIGQLLAKPTTFVSAGVHASISGTVVELGEHVTPHPSGIAEPCIVIENDFERRWCASIQPREDVDALTAAELRTIVRDAGIVGLGGAVFPSSAKLSPPRAIDTLVLNGVECEPYITCDDLTMRERARCVVRGGLLLQRMVSAQRCLIAVEDNKPDAYASLRIEVDRLLARSAQSVDISVVKVPTVFPMGGEKQLIKTLTGRDVPVGGLPYEVGIVCLNVGTSVAVHDAVYMGRPLVGRVVTVTGEGVREPGNFDVPLGAPVADLLQAAGGVNTESPELTMGGPMMGVTLPGVDTMVVKASNCILVRPADVHPAPAMPCIRCGSCANACPMKLLPQQLYWHAAGKQFDDMERYQLDACIECGCCSAVCPSHIPLVGYFRYSKSQIREQTLRRQRADEARLRSQSRTERLETLKREQEERKARRKAGRKKAAAGSKPPSNAQDASAPAVKSADAV